VYSGRSGYYCLAKVIIQRVAFTKIEVLGCGYKLLSELKKPVFILIRSIDGI